jgi:hypothetical protein
MADDQEHGRSSHLRPPSIRRGLLDVVDDEDIDPASC